jgi:hypothetical protein
MGKVAPDALNDALLDYIAGCDLMIACSAEPSSYADATASVDLATAAMTPVTDFTKANDTSGRKVTMAAKAGVTIDHTGDATHIALCKSSDSTLRAVTTCTQQTLTQGGTVDFPAWKWNVQDPS